ncbi:glycosyltransferase family 2 protein [Chromobacterium vaccinii]|uniref:glycosyltransferase family 2 protein n=1 Tax=Chromobacterium vaccinii TaxID=1108595 RepID=UPI00326041C1
MNTQISGQVYVLIPSHNRRDILCATLAKVRAQLPPKTARLIVVDAGSTDGTRDAVKAQCPSAEIVDGHADMWWTATVNHGLKHIAKTARAGDRVLLMNDDIDLAPMALIRLLEASELEPGAVIGAVNIVHRPGEEAQVYFCGGRYDLRFARHKVNIRGGAPWQEPASRFLETDFLYGRLLVIPWSVFEAGCGFDEEVFPQYCADEDFAYGAKLRGFKVLVDSRSVVYVNEETTASFSLSLGKGGWRGVRKALTAFNSCYNWRQGWAFSRRYAKWPAIYMLCRYGIIFISENLRTLARKQQS